MNQLNKEKQEMVLSLLVECNSIRSIERITGVHRDTIMRLMVKCGNKAQLILDNEMQELSPKRIQVDEVWCFVGKKQKRLTPKEKKIGVLGDQYLYVALDADTKLVPAFYVDKKTTKDCLKFISELSTRINHRYQLSTDSYQAYFDVIDKVYGCDIDYGQIHKIYQNESKSEKKYSPTKIVEVIIKKLSVNPLVKHISTSFVERQNLTIRMQLRRFTRLTNAFLKKLENLKAAVALHFYYYNFMRIQQSLRVTPAMELKITGHIWNCSDLLSYDNSMVAA